MNPLHPDNIYPMDKAMELIYEDFGREDGLIQTEVLQYIPGQYIHVSNQYIPGQLQYIPGQYIPGQLQYIPGQLQYIPGQYN